VGLPAPGELPGRVEDMMWLMQRLMAWYIGTGRNAKVIRHGHVRLIDDFCDYGPHYHVMWFAVLRDGHRFGQSCTRHAGALLLDALDRDPAATIERI
jgi:hypothetical protein